MSEIPYSVRSNRGVAISNIPGLNWNDTRDDELIKKIDSTTAGGSGIQTVFANDPLTGTKNDIIISNNQDIFNVVLGAIFNTFAGLGQYTMRLIPRSTITSSEAGITLFNDASAPNPNDVRVGINITNPDEALEVDGSIQIDSANFSRLKFQKSGGSPHQEAEIDGETDGTNGGLLEFYTKIDGGSLTEKLRINNKGAIGIGGANYGTTNQVLTSNTSTNSVSWEDQIDTTYSQGTGVSISPSNVISIGQSVGTTDSPSFSQMTLGKSGTTQGIINFNDFTNLGFDTLVAQIKGVKEGGNGGKIQFFTKVDGGSLAETFIIKQNGAVKIRTDGVALQITSQDGITEQGYIYNSSTGTKDLTIDVATGSSSSKGVAFKNAGVDILKIGANGALSLGSLTNFGNPDQVLTSNGTGSPASWATPFDKVIFAVRGTGTQNMNNIITSWRTPVINVYNTLWNSGTGTYTIPTAGNYRISFRTVFQNTGDSRSCDTLMYKNGLYFTSWSVITSTLPPGSPEYYSASIDFIDAFNINDTIYFRGLDPAGTFVLDNAFFSITKIY